VTFATSRIETAVSADAYAARARARNILVCAGVLLLTVASTGAMLRFGAKPALVAPLAVGLVAAAVLARPVIGLYLLLSGALLFEQFAVSGVSSITSELRFFENLSSFTDFPLRLSLADVLIVLVLVSLLLRRLTGTADRLRGGPLLWPVLGYGAVFILGLGIGIARGASWNDLAALAELRAPVHLCALYFLTANLVRTSGQAWVVLRILVAVTAIKAVQGLWTFQDLRSSGIAFETVTPHEEVLFFNLVPILALAMLVLGVRTSLRRWLLLLTPVALAIETVTQRRVGFVALAAGVAITLLLLRAERPRRTMLVMGVGAVVLSAYAALAWNDPGWIAEPLRPLRSIVASQDLSERDRLSNLWRSIENANIAFTISQLPLTGVGLGQQYLFQQEPQALDAFVYWRYITHNAIFWLWLKAGVLGFFAFWFLVGQAILVGGGFFRRLARPELKIIAIVPVALVAMQVVFSSVDLGLHYSRTMIVLGVALGLLAQLGAYAERNPAEASRAVSALGLRPTADGRRGT